MLNHVTEQCKHHEQFWIYLDYVYCSCDCWRSAHVSWHLCISYPSYLLYPLSVECLGWCGAGRGRAGLVCIDWVLGPETRGAEDWWQIRVRHMHPTITPSHRRFCHLVIVSTLFSSITRPFRMCCNNGWLVCTSELWWPSAYIENEIKSVTCRT